MDVDFEELFSKRMGAIRPGLERMSRALASLNLGSQGRTILVAGTNGKGGTAGFLWSLLAAEAPAGLFTSPHLCSFEERFQLSDGEVARPDVVGIWQSIQDQLGELYQDLSFFELCALMAYSLFSQRNCTWQVMEVGMGGRWDATNAVSPEISVITSLSRDHEEFLGSQIIDILKEKLGVCRPGVPLFWGEAGEIVDDPAAIAYFDSYIADHQIPCFRFAKHFGYDGEGGFIQLHQQRYHIPFPPLLASRPDFIKRNFLLACAVFAYLYPHSLEHLTEIMAHYPRSGQVCPNSLVARYQRLIVGDRRVIIDVCHNPNGMGELSRALKQEQSGPQWGLVSILRDKNFDDMLDMAREIFQDRLILFGIDHQRSLQSSVLAERHRRIPFYDTFEAAWDALPPSSTHEPLVICGSVIAVGKVLQQFEADPKAFSIEQVLASTWTDAPHLTS